MRRLPLAVVCLSALPAFAASTAPAAAQMAASQPFTPEVVQRLSERAGRPITTYKVLEQQAAQSEERRVMFAAGDALPIYLNRFGGRYTCGDDDSSRNVSSVACNGGSNVADVSPFDGSDAQWNGIVECVQAQFAAFHVVVTDVEPTGGDYVEAVMSGTPDEAGMPFGVGGVAPFSCGMIPSGVVYAFSGVYGGPRFVQDVCETAAQEIAHAFGLDHEFLCEDPMTYLTDCGNKEFRNIDAQCGEFEPRQCQCDGGTNGASQNSVQLLLERLGAADGTEPPPRPDDHADPVVELVAPDADANLIGNATIEVSARASDDVGLSVVELVWDFTNESMFCPGSGGSWSCSKSGDLYTWSIQVGLGPRDFRVHVRDVVGNEATTETRSVWLSEDGSPKPDDTTPPIVVIGSPVDGAVLPSNSQIQVVATILDDNDIMKAELDWPFSSTSFPCPYQDQTVSCAVDGSTYTWSLQVGSGARSFRVRGVDIVGNVTETDLLEIRLQNGATVPEEDGNDTVDQATTTLGCDDSLEVVSTDTDWFVVDAPAGKEVTVSVNGAQANDLNLVATVDADGDAQNLDFTAADDTIKVGVVPDNANVGDYTIEVSCRDPKPKDTSAPQWFCGASGSSAPVAVLGALLLGVRRRRR